MGRARTWGVLKRSIREANSFNNAMETIFIEEEFGDYNEKAFVDVRNWEELWDWTESVLMPGGRGLALRGGWETRTLVAFFSDASGAAASCAEKKASDGSSCCRSMMTLPVAGSRPRLVFDS